MAANHEEFTHLMDQVAGYSDYDATQPAGLQDELITRTEHTGYCRGPGHIYQLANLIRQCLVSGSRSVWGAIKTIIYTNRESGILSIDVSWLVVRWYAFESGIGPYE